eukprot:5755214-Amphidinium_carterae.1
MRFLRRIIQVPSDYIARDWPHTPEFGTQSTLTFLPRPTPEYIARVHKPYSYQAALRRKYPFGLNPLTQMPPHIHNPDD